MTPERITIHCSDTPNGRVTTVEEIRSWHLARGWRDIGYHYVIYTDGTVHEGRPITEQGAHVELANENNVGICMAGRTAYSAAQFRGLRTLLDTLCTAHKIPAAKIYGHYEFPSAKVQGKSCPNMDANILRDWYANHDEQAIEPYVMTGDAV